jgi:hypothetical protein
MNPFWGNHEINVLAKITLQNFFQAKVATARERFVLGLGAFLSQVLKLTYSDT